MTVSADQSSVLWDVRGATPKKLSVLRGLPNGMFSQSTHVQDFVSPARGPWDLPDRGSRGSSTSASSVSFGVDGHPRFYPVVFGASGHKIVAASLPPHNTERTLKPRYFTDTTGQKVRSFAVQSIALLPLWRMMLLGGQDDKIRICL